MIRRLAPEDAVRYAALRLAMLNENPFAFASSSDDDPAVTEAGARERLAGDDDQVVFGAFEPGGELLGTAGIYRDRHRKSRHRMHIWGVYVIPSRRGDGWGRALVRAVVDHARTRPGVRWVHLGVSSFAPGARKLYESEGFVHWGTEPEVLTVEGRSSDEFHLALRLADDPREGSPPG